jgi:flagellar biosynthesis/type III secretory pathway M-ring protein FliF/YscJ
MGNAAIVLLVLLALIWLAVRVLRRERARNAELDRIHAEDQRRLIVADAELWALRRATEAQGDRKRRESRASSGSHCPTQPHTQMTYGATDSGCSGGSCGGGSD